MCSYYMTSSITHWLCNTPCVLPEYAYFLFLDRSRDESMHFIFVHYPPSQFIDKNIPFNQHFLLKEIQHYEDDLIFCFISKKKCCFHEKQYPQAADTNYFV